MLGLGQNGGKAVSRRKEYFLKKAAFVSNYVFVQLDSVRMVHKDFVMINFCD